MSNAPYFIESEIDRFDAVFRETLVKRRPIFLVRCSNLSSRSRDIEPFVAAYLLINLLLMGQFHRKILKLVYIQERHSKQVFAVLNALRALFHSHFSSLHEIESWKKVIEARTAISAPSLARMEDAVRFIEGSGNHGRHPVFSHGRRVMGVHGSANNSRISQFSIDQKNIFTADISTKTQQFDILTSELFVTDCGITVKFDRHLNAIIVDIDFSHQRWLETWMQNVEFIVFAKLFAGKP